MSGIPYGRADRWITGVLLLVTLVLSWPRLEGPIDLRYDAGVYYLTGTALGAGHGYRILSEPGDIQAVQYPPLLPAIVAVVQRSLATNDPAVAGHALRLLYLLLSATFTVAAYAVGRHFLPPLWA